MKTVNKCLQSGTCSTLKVPVICTNPGGFGPGLFQPIFGVGRLSLSRRFDSALSRFGPISIGIGIEAVQGRVLLVGVGGVGVEVVKMQLGSALEDNPIRQGRVGVGVTFFFDLSYLTQGYLKKSGRNDPPTLAEMTQGRNDTGQKRPGSICTHSPHQRWV